jgi:hypothetical protein
MADLVDSDDDEAIMVAARATLAAASGSASGGLMHSISTEESESASASLAPSVATSPVPTDAAHESLRRVASMSQHETERIPSGEHLQRQLPNQRAAQSLPPRPEAVSQDRLTLPPAPPALQQITVYQSATVCCVRMLMGCGVEIDVVRQKLVVVGSKDDLKSFHMFVVRREQTETLSIHEESRVYSEDECFKLLATMDDMFEKQGGLRKRLSAFALIGAVRFLEGYYLMFVTQRRPVAALG